MTEDLENYKITESVKSKHLTEKTFANDDEYFADKEFASNSMIRDFTFCQYLFEGKHITNMFVDDEEKDYFIFGSAVDCLLTEPPELFGKRFMVVAKKMDIGKRSELAEAFDVVMDEIKEKEAAGKAHKLLDEKLIKLKDKIEMCDTLEGVTQITQTVYDHIKAAADELLRQPLYQMFGVGSNGRSQEIITAEIDGKKVKGKLDYINVEKRIIADVKTTASMERFDPRMYAKQLAFYRKLASIKYGIPEEEWDCYILAVDKLTDKKRSEIFCISKNLLNPAEVSILDDLNKYYEVKEMGFYQPITETDGAMISDVRRTTCYKCQFYNQCDFSLQKEITYIQ